MKTHKGEPVENPGNTKNTCRECRKEIKPGWRSKSDSELCLSCEILSRVEEHSRGDLVCNHCNGHVSRLSDEGYCFDCTIRLQEKKEAERAHEKMVRERRASLEHFLGGPEAVKMTFENFDIEFGNSRAFEAASQFDPLKDNLYLYGKVGRGKSHLAFALLQKFYLMGKRCARHVPRTLINEFRGKDTIDQNRAMEKLVKADVVLVDDIGIKKSTEFAIEILCEILDERARLGRGGFVFTSNHSLDELQEKNNDDRLTSRIFGMAGVKNVILVDSIEDGRIKKGVSKQ